MECNCKECEYKFRCNIRPLKEAKESQKNETGDEPIDREKVKVLFERRLNGNWAGGTYGDGKHGKGTLLF